MPSPGLLDFVGITQGLTPFFSEMLLNFHNGLIITCFCV